MRLYSPHFPQKPWPTVTDVRRAFRLVGQKDFGDDPFLLLDDVSDYCQGYVQAAHDPDGWRVEIRRAGDPKHYRTPGPLPESLAARMFEEFLHLGNRMFERYTWDDVTEQVARRIAECLEDQEKKPGEEG